MRKQHEIIYLRCGADELEKGIIKVSRCDMEFSKINHSQHSLGWNFQCAEFVRLLIAISATFRIRSH